MKDVLPVLLERWRNGETIALATVVQTFRSAPRPPGAAMVVAGDGAVFGSVSGGCVDGAVHELATRVISEDLPPVMSTFGVSDGDAFAIGLPCGGTIDILTHIVSRQSFPDLDVLAGSITRDEDATVVTLVRSGGTPRRLGCWLVLTQDETHGTLGGPTLDRAVVEAVRSLPSTVGVQLMTVSSASGDADVLISRFRPAPRMIVLGADEMAAALTRIGSFLGFRVTLCDARPVFATPERFPAADVVVAWPHRYLALEAAAGRVDPRTVIVVLTHDAKFDVPAIQQALAMDVAFVGAMGSRKTHADRLGRLRQAGVPAEDIGKLRSRLAWTSGSRRPRQLQSPSPRNSLRSKVAAPVGH